MTTTQPTFEDFLAWLEDSRGRGQVHFDEKAQCWQVLGHPETSAVLSDPAVFSSDLTALQPKQDDLELFQRGNFVRMDPPRHGKLRTLVSQAFTPRVVADLEPRIAEMTDELLDQVGERFDLIDALAYPLPVVVIAELLGVPLRPGAVPRVGRRAARPRGRPRPGGGRGQRAGGEGRRADDAADERLLPGLHQVPTGRPGDDLTSTLVSAEVDGERLADEEIVGFVGLLLIAGHITTTATLGNSLVSFQDNPEAAAQVRADPMLFPAAIEEVLRVRTPFPRAGADHEGRRRGGRRAHPGRTGRDAVAGRGQPGPAGVHRSRTGSTSTASPTPT